MTDIFSAAAFRQSRIYAEGWNAARSASQKAGETVPNPYTKEPERSRWLEGFTQALGN